MNQRNTLRSFIRAGESLYLTPTHPEVFHFVGLESEILTNLPASTTRIARTRFGLEDTQGGGRENFFCPPEGPRSNQANSNGCVALIATRALQLRVANSYMCKLLDLLATKGIRGILDGTIVKNGEGVPASALTISIDIWACRIKGARLNS